MTRPAPAHTAFRNSAKAIIVRRGQLLVTRNKDPWGDWFILPGGGQRQGETLHAALQRECLEEIGARVVIGRLALVREYIGKNHEFARWDPHAHQVEFMFECRLAPGAKPRAGSTPDSYQTGVAWLPLRELHRHRLYPSCLRRLLRHGSPPKKPVYLGDVN